MKNDSTILLNELSTHLEIKLNRPEKRNALNSVMVHELKNILENISNNPNIKTVSIKGQGKAFCSGADLGHLKKLRSFNYEENLRDSQALADLYLKLYCFPKPVIAVVNGPALAGGFGLANVCDFVIASESATFGYPEVKIGFVAALVSAFLQRQAGERNARYLLLSGTIISANQAKSYGLVNEVCAPDKIDIIEKELINLLQKNSASAMQATKQLFSKKIEDELTKLSRLNALHRESDDFLEGISAFIEKRKPKWSET